MQLETLAGRCLPFGLLFVLCPVLACDNGPAAHAIPHQDGGQDAEFDASVIIDSAGVAPRSCDADSSDTCVKYSCADRTVAAPQAVATKLARFIWHQSSTSEDLVQKMGGAVSPSSMRAVAHWMLGDPRARDGVAAFIRSWLRLDDLTTIEKPAGVLTADLISSMQKEAPAFATAVIVDGDAKYDTLMLAPYTYVDEELANHYGMSGIAGTMMRKVFYDSGDRVGILGGAGVLTRFSGTLDPPWPPRRFWLSYETLLCDFAGLPAAMARSTRFDPNVKIREDLDIHTSPADCMACHVSVNPIGYSFSKFDTLGRIKLFDERGAPIDTTETIPPGLTVADGLTVSGAADMIRQLVKRPEVRRCFVARLFDYALNPASRLPTSAINGLSADLQCDLSQADDAFERSGGNIRELIMSIVATGAFTQGG